MVPGLDTRMHTRNSILSHPQPQPNHRAMLLYSPIGVFYSLTPVYLEHPVFVRRLTLRIYYQGLVTLESGLVLRQGDVIFPAYMFGLLFVCIKITMILIFKSYEIDIFLKGPLEEGFPGEVCKNSLDDFQEELDIGRSISSSIWQSLKLYQKYCFNLP